jgi:S1-C subfamily serine protease
MRKRGAVYSSSRRQPVVEKIPPAPVASPAPKPAAKPGAKQARRRRWTIPAGIAALFLVGLALFLVPSDPAPLVVEEPPQREMTAADAYEKIRGSVVMVLGSPYDGTEEVESKGSDSTGTGVVIVDSGIILTNLHVVDGAKRIRVVFADGMEAAADLIGSRPEHDLAVLKAQSIPTTSTGTLARTAGLLTRRTGGRDPASVRHRPFGVRRRDFKLGRSTAGEAGQPHQPDPVRRGGESRKPGGPLVTNEGEVIGIVTGLLNPTEQRVFVGIGFAVPIENAAAAAGLPPF